MSYPLLARTLFPIFLHYRSVAVEGIERLPSSGAYILAPNHIGFIDAPILSLVMAVRARRKVYYITKQTVWTFFQQLRLCEWMGMIPLITDDPHRSLEEAERAIRAGRLVGIFPEARRNPFGELLKPKTGVARLAYACGVPIVPVGLVMPAGMTTMEAIRNSFNRTLPMMIRFGRPILVSKKPSELLERSDLDQLMNVVMNEISNVSGKSYHSLPFS